jgi:hypothetical protein
MVFIVLETAWRRMGQTPKAVACGIGSCRRAMGPKKEKKAKKTKEKKGVCCVDGVGRFPSKRTHLIACR